ncbi:MAG: phosphoribosylamine--glycine ligase [Dehalococcoidia bacterium]|nr:phosphoribosylamine--glycine ligase [Dehalococcoidia bacterium]
MNVLVVGSGAREHALGWKLAQSPQRPRLFFAPGNGGMASLGTNLALRAEDIEDLSRAAQEHRIDLTVVGPEAALVAGLADLFSSRGQAVFGPSRAAAEIEGSKTFARDLCRSYGIPIPEYAVFTSYDQAVDYVERKGAPIVVKADGLAAGKGVTVAATIAEAKQALFDLMRRKLLGPAGERVLIEECLVGREVSLHALVDGETVVPLPSACDYKRVSDGDRGPNTGGMGAYSPPVWFTAEQEEQAHRLITVPIARALVKEGRPYRGLIYPGLMITSTGPKVVEFNCRFGDPETQVILPRLEGDLLELLLATATGRLVAVSPPQVSEQAAVAVVLASGGYPGDYQTGKLVTGIRNVDQDVTVFHGGTALERPREEAHRDYYQELVPYTSGGRALTIVGRGATVAEARAKVYKNAGWVNFEGVHYRRDIALGIG